MKAVQVTDLSNAIFIIPVRIKKVSMLVFFIVAFPSFATPQQTAHINFLPQWSGIAILPDSLIQTVKNEWIQFSSLKWYCSSLWVKFSDGSLWHDPKAHRLIDFTDKETCRINVPHLSDARITAIHFQLGVDSLTQAAGAMGQDLDPTNGMYWTWQSGYIHAKIEGTSSLSSHRKKEFALHLGGFKHPFNTIRQVHLPVDVPKKELLIVVDMASFTNACSFSSHHHIMSPSETACVLASQFASSFQLGQP